MSLVQLLAVGRSLCSIRDQPSRYKMTQQNRLPKFGLPTHAESIAAVAESRGVTLVRNAGAQARMPGGPGKEEATMNAIEIQSKASPKTSVAVPAQPYPSGRWTMKNPFHRSPGGGKTSTPVQGEFSLDAIRPVRNDLSDSDLEIVPAGPPVDPPARRPAPGAARMDSFEDAAKPLWSRLRARLLRRV